jgi:hypothetical protein
VHASCATLIQKAPIERYGVYELSPKQSIAELAYHLWNARGRPHGSEEEDWLEAERRLATEKEADRDGGGRQDTLDVSLKETLPARGPAASHSPKLPSSSVRNKSNAGDKKSAAGRRSRSEAKSTLRSARASDSAGNAAPFQEVSNPPVDETDDGPNTAPRDIGEG